MNLAVVVSFGGLALTVRRAVSTVRHQSSSSRLISPQQLQPKIGKAKIFDATWFMPNTPRDAEEEFKLKHIPTALRFNLDRLSDQDSPLPHMLPNAEWFALQMDELGVSPEDEIVVYDTLGQFSAPRAFWHLRVLGARNVLLLDGGLPAWERAGGELESGSQCPAQPNKPGSWLLDRAPLRTDQVVSVREIERGDLDVVDARPAGRFLGQDPEPRPGLKSGRIPHSRNVPFKAVLNADGTFKSKQELERVFESAGVDLSSSKLVTSCGSGTTAAVLSFALEHLLGKNAPLYDGSFSEYADVKADRPVIV